MPKQPLTKRCSTPSRSANCAARNRISAWAMVRRTVMTSPLSPRLRLPYQRPERRRRAADTAACDTHHHLSSVEAGGKDPLHRICREAIIQLKLKAGQATAVHRAEDHLAVQRTQQGQILDDVRGPEKAIDTRTAERRD